VNGITEGQHPYATPANEMIAMGAAAVVIVVPTDDGGCRAHISRHSDRATWSGLALALAELAHDMAQE
jgi:hypothetical protein